MGILTNKEFIEKAKRIHGDKYDYSKVIYKGAHIKICIICPKHGEFWQKPNSHLNMRGCPECANENKRKINNSNTKEFTEKAKRIHGNKYDYSKVEYINNKTKVCIVCPKHGEFWQKPSYHLGGSQCQKCAEEERSNKRKDSIEEFIEKAKRIHGDKYDYSKVEYINSQTKVCIICTEHGEFWQKPNKHLNGHGCPKCGGTSKLTQEEFIKKAKKAHGDKYDYSKVEYINSETKVCIICPEHGEFWQKANSHLNRQGCPKCNTNYRNFPYTTKEFIEKAKEVHGDKYDYSKVEYTRANKKICVICPKHGEFWQEAGRHIFGVGCPICKESKMEKECRKFLIENNIKFESQKTFNWLKNNANLFLDFYLPDYNIAIECQGIQHFKPIGFGNKDKEKINKTFNIVQERDKKKLELCKEHNIEIIYINYNDNLKQILNNILWNNLLENKL